MYLRKYKISKAAFFKNTSQQLPLYIIWFRVSPNWKYFLSEMYVKPSQTSKMKLLAKVGNTSRDIFRTVFSIQNIFRTSRMALFTKIMNGSKPLTFSAKSSILDILLGLMQFNIQWHVLPGIKCITEVGRLFTVFILVCTWFVWFTSLCASFIWTSSNVMSIVSITHTVIFAKQEVSTRWVVHGSPGENKCSWNSGKKK